MSTTNVPSIQQIEYSESDGKPIGETDVHRREIAQIIEMLTLYFSKLKTMSITITNTRPEHLAALAEHQKICFPTLDPSAWMTAEHFASHLRLFPEGQHVALDGDRVVGQSSTFRISGARAFNQHQYMDILGQSYFTNHDPNGEWLYGADMSVHPEYRGRKISTLLYDARKDLVRRLGLRGMVAGGMIPGYRNYRNRMAVAEYAD